MDTATKTQYAADIHLHGAAEMSRWLGTIPSADDAVTWIEEDGSGTTTVTVKQVYKALPGFVRWIENTDTGTDRYLTQFAEDYRNGMEPDFDSYLAAMVLQHAAYGEQRYG